MRHFACLLLACSLPLACHAAGPDERPAIERALAGRQLTASSDARPVFEDFDRMLELARRPMSEVSKPSLVTRAVRLLAPGVAIVDASITQFGSLTLVSEVPVFFVLIKENGEWRIAAARYSTR